MAEFNIFLGTGRKSIGDITLFRRDGRQIARVRVRNIGNPKSEGQSIQRNYVAPVSKFYGALADVLARSFEGLNKSDSYNEFQRTNIRLARTNGWFLNKYTPFYPLPYQLSRGSLRPISYYIDEDASGNEGNITLPGLVGTGATLGTISETLIANGYKTGDVVTFIVIVRGESGEFLPYSCQMYVNPLDSRTMSAIVPVGLHITAYDNYFVVDANGLSVDGLAVIVSRPSCRGWLRSTNFLAVASSIIAKLTSAEQRASAIASYEKQDSGSGGEVYPGGDGEAFNVATLSGRALLFYGGQYNAKVVSVASSKVITLKPANLDDYFYIYNGDGEYLTTNAAASLSPGDWSYDPVVGLHPADDVVIQAAAGSDMERYLQSIGVNL